MSKILSSFQQGRGTWREWFCASFFRGFWLNWYLGLGELRFGEALGGTEGGYVFLGLARDYMTSPLSFERETRLMVWVYKNSGWVHFSQIWPLFWKRRFGLEFLLFQTFHFSDKFCVKMEPAEPLYTCPPGLPGDVWPKFLAQHPALPPWEGLSSTLERVILRLFFRGFWFNWVPGPGRASVWRGPGGYRGRVCFPRTGEGLHDFTSILWKGDKAHGLSL